MRKNYGAGFITLLVLVSAFLISGCGKSEEDYKKSAILISPDELEQRVNDVEGKVVYYTGPIKTVQEHGKELDLSMYRRSTPLVVHYKMKDNDVKLEANDIIQVWGTLHKPDSKKGSDSSSDGSGVGIDAQYVSRPVWNILNDPRTQWTTQENGQTLSPDDPKAVSSTLYIQKINPDGIEVGGAIVYRRTYFYIRGTIDDHGVGSYEYTDARGTSRGIKGTLKINNNNEIEVETAKISQEILVDYTKNETVEINGKYTFRRNK